MHLVSEDPFIEAQPQLIARHRPSNAYLTTTRNFACGGFCASKRRDDVRDGNNLDRGRPHDKRQKQFGYRCSGPPWRADVVHQIEDAVGRMTRLRTTVVAAFALCFVAAALFLARPHAAPSFKINVVSAAEEQTWIDAVKTRRLSDDSTVWEALQFAEKMRPSEFKVGPFDVGHGVDGEPGYVGIRYWIGAKRLLEDAFEDLGYVVRQGARPEVSVPVGAAIPEGKLVMRRLQAGRDDFLRYIDEKYKQNCMGGPDKDKIC
jgi:hypothetical protein